MDKFEYQAKLEEISKLVETENYEEAVQIADTIEWKRVRSVRTLCTVSEIYEAVGRIEDSKAILSRAYRRSPNSRQILYRLTEVCVLTQEFDDAVEYYTEYVNLSPNDSNKYVLKYEIYKGRGSSIEEQIKVLEELKEVEYSEQWAYELASLYEQAGMTDKCVAECNDLALWFHSGKYVVKALELKKKYAPLTLEQQTIYENPSEIVDMETKEAVIEKAVPTLDEEITKDLPASETDVIADSILMNTEKEIAAAITEHKAAEKDIESEDELEEAEEEVTTEEIPAKKEHRRFDTVSLQAELANSMRQILSGIKPGKKNAAADKKEKEETVEENPVEDLVEDIAEETADAVEEILKEIPEETVTEETAEVKETEKVFTEEEVLSAATINLGEVIRKEIGEQSLREYAVAKEKEKEDDAALTVKVEEEVPEVKIPVLEALKLTEEAETISEVDIPEIKAPVLDIPEVPVIKKAPEIRKFEDLEKEKIVEEDKVVPEEIEMPEELPVIEELPEIPEEDTEEYFDEEVVEEEEKMAEVEEVMPVAPVEEEKPVSVEKKAVDPMNYSRNGLDEKEKEMLGFWGSIRGINEQVDSSVELIMRSALADKTSSTGNVVLVGDAGNGRTTLAIAIAKIVCRCKGQQKAKVAKIYAEDLNNKDIAQVISKISGGVLIIEEAGDLSDGTISQLSMAMDFKTDALVVFLEDERRYLQDLLARNPKFAQKFDITINVPMLTNDELVEFGKYYAKQNDCVLADNAILALYDAIGAMQTPEQPVAILDVKELMDKAIRYANAFGLGKMFSTISGKRYDEENRTIIKASAFKKIK